MNEAPVERRQRLYRTEAIVLKRRDYGEADRLLTVFTPEHGKLVLLGKGVRKTQSRKAGHVELFTHSTLLVAKGRTWDLVTQAETVESFLPLRESLLRTSYGYYVAELLDGFTQEHDVHPAMWRLLRETLGRLAASKEETLALAARFYDLHLLMLAGYQPQLFTCVACQAALEPTTNYFSIVEGGVLCPQHGEGRVDAEPLPLPLFKALRFVQTREWQEVAQLNLSPGLHAELERLLHGYIVYQLERNVRSAAFLRTIREQVQSVTRNS
ncbi:MAG TPA: DNA repair protein RecO [Anaerolineae bacterium]|nr:DNA repair protein RecO [Anaerolineae bacterium]